MFKKIVNLKKYLKKYIHSIIWIIQKKFYIKQGVLCTGIFDDVLFELDFKTTTESMFAPIVL